MNTVSAFALVVFVVYAAVAFGWRSYVQYRRTGSTGFKGISGAPLSAEWSGGVLFVVAMIALPVAAILDLTGALPAVVLPLGVDVVGVLLCAFGIVGTVVSQNAMGRSWRIGVDATEATVLVHRGPFGLVRNPIFTMMTVAAVGFALLVPGVVAVAAVFVLVIAIELQVRVVEEPYLRRTHGAAWRAYAARVGRFVPGLGTVR